MVEEHVECNVTSSKKSCLIEVMFSIIMIIIISIFKEDNAYNMNASLPYGPSVNTDIDYYRTFLFL